MKSLLNRRVLATALALVAVAASGCSSYLSCETSLSGKANGIPVAVYQEALLVSPDGNTSVIRKQDPGYQCQLSRHRPFRRAQDVLEIPASDVAYLLQNGYTRPWSKPENSSTGEPGQTEPPKAPTPAPQPSDLNLSFNVFRMPPEAEKEPAWVAEVKNLVSLQNERLQNLERYLMPPWPAAGGSTSFSSSTFVSNFWRANAWTPDGRQPLTVNCPAGSSENLSPRLARLETLLASFPRDFAAIVGQREGTTNTIHNNLPSASPSGPLTATFTGSLDGHLIGAFLGPRGEPLSKPPEAKLSKPDEPLVLASTELDTLKTGGSVLRLNFRGNYAQLSQVRLFRIGPATSGCDETGPNEPLVQICERKAEGNDKATSCPHGGTEIVLIQKDVEVLEAQLARESRTGEFCLSGVQKDAPKSAAETDKMADSAGGEKRKFRLMTLKLVVGKPTKVGSNPDTQSGSPPP